MRTDLDAQIGKVYNQLTVVSFSHSIMEKWNHYYNCLCTCGKSSVVRLSNLKSGNTRSCGCFKRKAISVANTRHGKSHLKSRNVWRKMILRCEDPNNPDFQGYGGRGIYVSDSWKAYENFVNDMGEPGPGLSIDRIDNDGPYSKENCRWATQSTQTNNTRQNVILEYRGERKSTAMWARQFNMPHATLRSRIKNGWPVELALTTKPDFKNKLKKISGTKGDG